jgi:hypothetical protein
MAQKGPKYITTICNGNITNLTLSAFCGTLIYLSCMENIENIKMEGLCLIDKKSIQIKYEVFTMATSRRAAMLQEHWYLANKLPVSHPTRKRHMSKVNHYF